MTPTPAERRRQLDQRFTRWDPATLGQSLDVAVKLYADRPLILTASGCYSYRQVADWSRRLASGLIAAGVPAGANVALIMGNFPEFVALKYAIARIGATAVPLNYLLRRHELRYVLEQSDCDTLITMNRLRDLDYLAELDAIAPDWERQGGGAPLPGLRQVFVHPTAPADPTPAAPRRDVRTIEDLAALATPDSDAELQRREMAGQAHSCSDIIYTSGTTGRSKGVMLTHDMVLRTAYASVYTRAFEDGRRILFALPMYHVFGYVECLVACTFVGGAIIPQANFDAEQMLDLAETCHATEIVCVPTMTLKLVEIARRRGFAHGDLIDFFNSGGATPPDLWVAIRDVFAPREICTAYGMSETTASTTCTLPEDPLERLLSTNGRLKPAGIAGDPALGGVLAIYKCVDPETGGERPAGVPGELLVRGPSVTPGYYRKPEETAAAFTDGWLHTGDIGVLAADGYLTLLGRIKESYRCGGEIVMPVEVEELLSQHPLVARALVVGIPDPRMGEVGCVCVVPAAHARPDPQELIDRCAALLARFKVPRHVIFIAEEDIPTTATGRPQKFKLAEWARQRLAELSPTNR